MKETGRCGRCRERGERESRERMVERKDSFRKSDPPDSAVVTRGTHLRFLRRFSLAFHRATRNHPSCRIARRSHFASESPSICIESSYWGRHVHSASPKRNLASRPTRDDRPSSFLAVFVKQGNALSLSSDCRFVAFIKDPRRRETGILAP